MSFARLVWEAEFGESVEYALQTATIDSGALGQCRRQSTIRINYDDSGRALRGSVGTVQYTITLDLEKINKFAGPLKKTALDQVALHELFHANTTCTDADHNPASFLMGADVNPRELVQFAAIYQGCQEASDDQQLQAVCIAKLVFSDDDRAYVAAFREAMGE